MKYIILSVVLLHIFPCKGQDDAHWDKKYLPTRYRKLITEEKAYLIYVKKQKSRRTIIAGLILIDFKESLWVKNGPLILL